MQFWIFNLIDLDNGELNLPLPTDVYLNKCTGADQTSVKVQDLRSHQQTVRKLKDEMQLQSSFFSLQALMSVLGASR